MTGVNPLGAQIAAAANTTTSSSGNSGTQQAPSNELNANSFITLLTTQLQAQDPLNPLDPQQMVSELTQMNTLQEMIQMRQDLDTLTSNAQGSTPGAGGTAGA